MGCFFFAIHDVCLLMGHESSDVDKESCTVLITHFFDAVVVNAPMARNNTAFLLARLRPAVGFCARTRLGDKAGIHRDIDV